MGYVMNRRYYDGFRGAYVPADVSFNPLTKTVAPADTMGPMVPMSAQNGATTPTTAVVPSTKVTAGDVAVTDGGVVDFVKGSAPSTGDVVGRIQASNGMPIPAARITLSKTGLTGIFAGSYSTTSDTGGNFAVTAPPGTYSAKIEATGYVSVAVPSLSIVAGMGTPLNVSMVPEVPEPGEPGADVPQVETPIEDVATQAQSDADIREETLIPAEPCAHNQVRFTDGTCGCPEGWIMLDDGSCSTPPLVPDTGGGDVSKPTAPWYKSPWTWVIAATVAAGAIWWYRTRKE